MRTNYCTFWITKFPQFSILYLRQELLRVWCEWRKHFLTHWILATFHIPLFQSLLSNEKRQISRRGTSLVAEWLRIRLPMQRTRVRALVQEDPTCRRATKLIFHNYWACALEPAHHNYWARPRTTATEARVPRAHALQQEKPPQWEAREPQRRVAPACLKKACVQQQSQKINNTK